MIRPTLSGDTSIARRLNLQSILRVLHEGGTHTITSLADSARISRPTASSAVDNLLQAGWIQGVEDEAESGRRMGRPARRFRFRPEAGHVLGVDVGAHKCLVLVSDLDGTVRGTARMRVDPSWKPPRRLRSMDEAVRRAVADSGVPADAIGHAAIATPGVIGPDGTVVHSPVMPGWVGLDLGGHLEKSFGYPARAYGDMPMAALGEHWLGAAQDDRDVVYLHVGHRMGTGLLIDGRPHTGHHGAAAEIGLWRALEWAQAYEHFLAIAPERTLETATALKSVFAAAGAGDEDARAGIEKFADYLIQGLAPVIVSVDPELLVIGGGISAAGPAIADPVRERIARETLFPPRVVCSALGDRSSALGAVRAALDVAEDELFAGLLE